MYYYGCQRPADVAFAARNRYGRIPMPDPTDVVQFKHSASQFSVPALEMYHLLNTIAHSPDLALKLKDAASKSDHKKADQLIQSAGIKSPYVLEYNPEGLVVTFQPPDANVCFGIRLSLCW